MATNTPPTSEDAQPKTGAPVFEIEVAMEDDSSSSSSSSSSSEPLVDASNAGAFFRGVAAAARAKIPVFRAASAKAVRSIGSNRPLAFASEGAVAGNALMPRWLYYGAWGLSGAAIGADITSRTWDAPENKQWETAAYWTAFHVPASLVVPAVIIHKVVDVTEHSMENHSYAKRIPVRVRPFVPVGMALLAIVPVVPTVDHLAEAIMEPTLGSYLGLEFHSHSHGADKEKED
mmetsp:Transcript_6151/g.17476  ORF Transcript_6151/g.17476 Transcript_6151/m.17476 type:complete len:232 (-) Transcript_6151:6058-6753(-)